MVPPDGKGESGLPRDLQRQTCTVDEVGDDSKVLEGHYRSMVDTRLMVDTLRSLQ